MELAPFAAATLPATVVALDVLTEPMPMLPAPPSDEA
jgi:hypothetical protein